MIKMKISKDVSLQELPLWLNLGPKYQVELSNCLSFPSTTTAVYQSGDRSGQFLVGGLPWILGTQLPGGKPEHPTLPVYRLNNSAEVLGTYQPRELKPESVVSYEIGYKGLIAKKLLIDVYYYTGQYENFIGRTLVAKPLSLTQNQIYSIVENAATMSSQNDGSVKVDPIKVKTSGYGLGLDYRLESGFSVFANYYHDELGNVPSDFSAQFNTPEHRINFGISHSGFGKTKCGSRYQWTLANCILWDADFATGTVPHFLPWMQWWDISFLKSSRCLSWGYQCTKQVLPECIYNYGGLYYVSFAYNIFDINEAHTIYVLHLTENWGSETLFSLYPLFS